MHMSQKGFAILVCVCVVETACKVDAAIDLHRTPHNFLLYFGCKKYGSLFCSVKLSR